MPSSVTRRNGSLITTLPVVLSSRESSIRCAGPIEFAGHPPLRILDPSRLATRDQPALSLCKQSNFQCSSPKQTKRDPTSLNLRACQRSNSTYALGALEAALSLWTHRHNFFPKWNQDVHYYKITKTIFVKIR